MSGGEHIETIEHVHRAIEALAYAIAEQSGINQLITGGLSHVGTVATIPDHELQAILVANGKMLDHLKSAVAALREIEGVIDES